MGPLLEFVSKPPNWIILILISTIFGAVLRSLFKFIVFCFRQLKRSDIERKWFGYYLISRNHQPYVGREIMNIGKGVFDSFIVRDTSITSQGQTYKGTVKLERNFIVIQMRPKLHEEEIFIRLKRNIPGNDEVMYGLWSALDMDGNAAVGPMILSRQELEEAYLNDIVKTKIKNIPEIRNMVVSL